MLEFAGEEAQGLGLDDGGLSGTSGNQGAFGRSGEAGDATMKVIAIIAGVALVASVWLSVLRTVFIPRYGSSLAARITTKTVAATVSGTAGRLPYRARWRLLELGAPLTLFSLVWVWLIGSIAGFSLLAWGSSAARFGSHALAAFFLLRQASGASGSAAIPLGAVALLSTALLLAAFSIHLIRVTDAYSRRERPVISLAAQAALPPDAEMLIASYLRAGSPDHFGVMLSEWAQWLADIQGTHLGYPVLIRYRQAGDLSWIRAAVIVLDCAALIEACAPEWSPPESAAVLAAGRRCLQGLAAQLDIRLPEIQMSLHGRETYPFNETMAKVRAAGVPLRLGEAEAQVVFQRLRVQYAPYANAIAERLSCDLGGEGRVIYGGNR